MPLKVSSRGDIPPFIVMDVMRAANERAAEGRDVLHLEVGQPSTPAPEGARRAAAQALEDNVLGYTDAFGVDPLRRRLARHYAEAYGVEVSPGNVVATTGSSAGFVLAFLTAFDAGDRVGVVAPGYPAYRHILKSLGVEPVIVRVGPETNFQPTADMLDAVPGRLDGLVVASPSNPTGTVIAPDVLAALAARCREDGIRLISDEIYHGIDYGVRTETALAHWRDAIVINSFSKYYSMTGWRLGWMVLPDELLRPVECVAQNLFISAPTLSQLAGAAALDCRDELDRNVARYAENRALLIEELPKAGFGKLSRADGAFYLYADASDRTDDSALFCRRMLDETGVAATPGVDFDAEEGHRFLRFCFAGATADMAEACRRLGEWGA